MADFAVKKRSTKKVSSKGNGNGYTGGGGGSNKTVYDDVFGGPPKFGVPSISSSGMIDDYSEIFGGFNSSRVSSIPILDLPVVDEKDVLIDVRGSKFDYSEVFGGFNGLDFAVSYEELLAAESKGGGGGGESSSDDAWTSAETGSPSEGSNEDPACSETNQTFSNEESYESDGIKQFNVSYQKSNQISRDGEITAITHIAQLNSVPAFTFLVDESIPSQKAEDNTSDLVTKFHSLDLDFGDHVNEEKDLKETISDQSVYHGIAQISECDAKHQTNHLKETISYEPFFPAVREISESDSVHQRNHLKETISFQPISHAVRQLSEGDSIHPKNHLKDIVTRIPEGALEPHGKPGGNGNHPSKGYLTVSEINLRTNPCDVTHIPERVLEPQGKPGGNGAHPSKGFVTVSEINLRTNPCHVPPPSRPPPKVSIWRGDSKIYTASHLRASDNSVLQRAIGDSSAQFYDVEVDASSSAEASAAAMKEAMDIAQARLKSAKELMERKKDGLQNRKKFGFKDESKFMKKKEWEAAPQAQYSNEKPNDIPEHADKEIKGFNVEDRAKAPRVVEVDEDLGVTGKKIVNASEETAEQNYGEETGSTQTSHGDEEEGEWKVEEQYYELVQTVIPRAVMETSKHESVEDTKSTRRESEVAHDEKHDENTKAAHELNMRGDYEKELDVAQEVCNHERNDNHCNLELEKEDDEKKLKEPSDESVSKLEQTHVQEEIEQFHEEERRREEFEEREKMARERQEYEKRLEEAREQEEIDRRHIEENERRQIEENEREESKKRLKESLEREEEDAKLLKKAQELEEKRREEAREHERRLKEELDREENEKKLKEAHEREVTEKRLREKEDNERRLREALEKEENERRLREALEREENERRLRESLEREENERRLREALEREETERRLREEKEEFEKRQTETREREEKERKVKEAREQEENVRRQQELKREENEKNAKAAQEALVHSKGEENLKASAGCQENADGGNTKKAAEEACRQDEDEVLAQMSTEPDLEKIREVDRGTKLQDGEKNFAEVQAVISQEKIERSKKMSQGAVEQEENNSATHKRKQLVENGRKLEAAHPTNVMDANSLNVSKNIEKKDKAESLSLEEREKEKRMQRERDRELERLRKVEEDREREREREKDRMAVERATREARERALADARERAERAAVERATAEARQRAVADARERLDRASAVAREKSVAEKSFTDGKIRAERDARLRLERAAVERATAEARERAAEKLKSDKAAFGARDRTERTYSEKYSSTSRDSGIRHSSSFSDLRDTQNQSSGASNSFQRYSNSSNHASNVSERYQGAETESAQRCKARLERHQRTVERAAKALAEKNMRDLLAQREQAERNRFSDTLDAEVRRWSNGKEGNLRALLSTLQYILGPDSGWHPVPLTEVITAVAVKKAYRKATLCVHPDKLQQRGATIQQKYICEKVFDLLKEAWNKFNSEER